MFDDFIRNNFVLGTKKFNFEDIVNNFEIDVDSASPFVLQNYKQYIIKTENVDIIFQNNFF